MMGRRSFQHRGNMGCAMLPALTAATQKWGAQREHPSLTTGERKRGFTLKAALCSNPAGFFLTEKYPDLHLSSSWGRAGSAQGSSSLPSRCGLGSPWTQLCMRGLTFSHTRSPGDPLYPREGPSLLLTASQHVLGGLRSCRGAQLPFPASPVCPCRVAPLRVQSLFQLWANLKKVEKSPGELFHPSLFMEQRYSQP